MREIKFRAFFEDIKEMDYDMSLEGMFAHYDIDSCILMQYTGLKDKNGKEIYEGDIVEFSTWNPKLVVYEKKRSGFCLKDTMLFLMEYDAAEMRVIGNIYETPELLEKEK